jgi:glutamate decarboxylase
MFCSEIKVSCHIDPVVQDKKSHFANLTKKGPQTTVSHSYGARYGTNPIPKYHLASKGIDPEAAYQLIHDELALGLGPTVHCGLFADPVVQMAHRF